MVYDSYFDSLFNSFFDDDFDSLYHSYKAPHTVKSICDSSFPASNVEVNKDTKQFRITVCLPGLSEDNIKLGRKDNVLTLAVEQKESSDESWRAIQSGFRKVYQSNLSWKIDTSKYDLDKLDVKFENGLLVITIEPTEFAKPKRIERIFGKLENDSKKIEEEKVEEKKEKKEE